MCFWQTPPWSHLADPWSLRASHREPPLLGGLSVGASIPACPGHGVTVTKSAVRGQGGEELKKLHPRRVMFSGSVMPDLRAKQNPADVFVNPQNH